MPGQGSIHLDLTQALFLGHSLLSTHSGLQPLYGSPRYSGLHVHIPLLHKALEPQGEGLQGSVSTGATERKRVKTHL